MRRRKRLIAAMREVERRTLKQRDTYEQGPLARIRAEAQRALDE
jgi:hypothetical protein